jgi:hypothetical protein
MTTILYKKTGRPVMMLFVAILCSTVLSSCKKEKVATSYNPVGYWNGNAYIVHTAILNKADGKSRIYFRVFGNDTAGSIIGNGSYTLTGNSFKAFYSINNNTDSIFIETKLDGVGAMNGKLYNTLSPDIVDCNLQKQ